MNINNKYVFPMAMSDVAKSLRYNGTYIPDVRNVTFSLKTEEKVPVLDENGKQKRIPAVNNDGSPIMTHSGEQDTKPVFEYKPLTKPILTTRVMFDDGTSVIVKNTDNDDVITKKVEVVKGSGHYITIADRTSKERGITYAIIKRLTSTVDERGFVSGGGLGRILSDLVDESHDQEFENAKAKIEKEARKAEYEKALAASKSNPKPKRYSYSDIVQMLGPVLDKLRNKIENDPGFIDRMMGA